MLECREYSAPEMRAYLKVKTNSQAVNKLNRYDVVYFLNGRGDSATFNIVENNDPFKVYCVFDMGFDPHSDFKKLRNYLFFLLGNDEYCWLPDEPMEAYLKSKGYTISRQTISKYRTHLEMIDYIGGGDFIYYKVYRDEYDQERHCPVEEEDYKKAWHLHWDKRNEEQWSSEQAFAYMYKVFGGVPRKQKKPYRNLFFYYEINYLMGLVTDSILDEVSGQRTKR